MKDERVVKLMGSLASDWPKNVHVGCGKKSRKKENRTYSKDDKEELKRKKKPEVCTHDMNIKIIGPWNVYLY